MKRFLLALLLISTTTFAQEQILIQFSASPSQPNATPYLKMLEIANNLQNKYTFILEFKPGANGVLALKAMDQSPTNRLATVAPAFVENANSGQINESDYVPIVTQGDACWAVITNIGDTSQGIDSLRGQQEITVGGTGYGNAAHLSALIIGEQLGFQVRYIVYKANFDALVQMAGGQPINFVIERVSNYQSFVKRNPNLQILGINCPVRNKLIPEVKTLAEQGYNTPTIFFSTVASVRMPQDKRRELAMILDQAQAQLGLEYIAEVSDMYPPMFAKNPTPTVEFFNNRVLQMQMLTNKYKEKINEAK